MRRRRASHTGAAPWKRFERIGIQRHSRTRVARRERLHPRARERARIVRIDIVVMTRGVCGVVLAPTRALGVEHEANARDGIIIARASRAALAIDDAMTTTTTTRALHDTRREREILASVARADGATSAGDATRATSAREEAREGAIASVRAATGAERALAALVVSALDADAEPERRNALARGAMTLRVMGFRDDALVVGALLACDFDVERAAILASM